MDRFDVKAILIGNMGVGKTTNIVATYKMFNESKEYQRHGILFKDQYLKNIMRLFVRVR